MYSKNAKLKTLRINGFWAFIVLYYGILLQFTFSGSFEKNSLNN